MIWDPHGVVLNANEAMARMLGVPVDALIGAPSDPSALLAPGGGSIPPEQLPAARVERTSGRVDQEFGIPHADGGYVWVSARSAPRPDGTIISAYTQITEAEAKARATARIATLVDDSPDLVWMFDAHGLIEYASPSLQRDARPAPGRGDRPPVARAHAPARRPRPARRARRRRPGRAAHRDHRGPPARQRRQLGLGRGPGDAALPRRHARSRSRSSAATSPARAPPRTRAGVSPRSSRRSSPARPTGS